jgi:hypothetical protein
MKKLSIGLCALSAMVLMGASCHKTSSPVAGKGGSTTLKVSPQHHGRSMNFTAMTVYIKYNTQDAPSNGVYDDSVHCTNADTVWTATFPQLQNGNYYLYGYGYDTSVNENVKGGSPYAISMQNTSLTFLLPVSED